MVVLAIELLYWLVSDRIFLHPMFAEYYPPLDPTRPNISDVPSVIHERADDGSPVPVRFFPSFSFAPSCLSLVALRILSY